MQGSMREKKTGVWELRVSTGLRRLNGQYIYKSKTFKGSKSGAQKALRNFVVEVENYEVSFEIKTFGELCEKWLESHQQSWAVSTFENNNQLINKYIVPYLGRKRADKVTAYDLERFYRSLELSPSTVKKIHRLVNSVFKDGCRWGVVVFNPASIAKQPKAVRYVPTTVTLEQVSDVLNKCDSLMMRLIVRLAVVTGARRNELLALRWRDIKGGVVTFSGSVYSHDGLLRVKETKTGIVKVLSLDKGTVDLLKSWRVKSAEDFLLFGEKMKNDWFIFRQQDQLAPIHPDTVSHKWRKLADRCGLVGVRFHDLRHATATHLIASGVDVVTVAGRLGHASPKMTLDVYSHALPAGDRRSAEILAEGLK